MATIRHFFEKADARFAGLQRGVGSYTALVSKRERSVFGFDLIAHDLDKEFTEQNFGEEFNRRGGLLLLDVCHTRHGKIVTVIDVAFPDDDDREELVPVLLERFAGNDGGVRMKLFELLVNVA